MKKSFLQFGIAVLLAFFISSFSGTLNGQTCPTGMIGYWKMSENSGPIYYDSYASFDATAPAASPSQTSGASGRGQMFDKASGTYLTIADDAVFDWSVSNDFSIEMWVKFAGTSASPRVFMARDDRPFTDMSWYIGDEGDGRITWFIQGSNGVNGAITTSSAYNNNQWHHVVVVRNGAIGRNYLYVDGVLQNPGGNTLTSFGSLASGNPLTIGNLLYVGSPDFHMTGAIDEVAIYNRTLDLATDILPHYSNVSQYQIGYCDGDEPMFLTVPVTSATVGQQYVYDVDASGNSKPTYSLIEAPTGMVINGTTGMITWTPASMSANGHVVVRATNNKGFVDQNFNIFLAGTPVCRNGLVSYWDFNQAGAAGHVDNIAGNVLTGAAPATVTGIAGSARQFNGVSDSLNLTDPPDPAYKFAGSLTFELWMKSDATPSTAMVMVGRDEDENNSEYFLGVYPNGNASFYLRDYPDLIKHGSNPNTLEITDAGTVNVLDGAWHHIVATYDENTGTVRLWVDKIKVAEATNEYFDDFGGNEPLNIGLWNRLDAGPRYWYEGTIDELAFYNTAMTQAQINESYDNAMAGRGLCTYNFAPVILSSPDSTVVQGSLYTYDIIATDINPTDILNISVVDKPAWMTGFTYTPGDSTAMISGTPGNDDVKIHSVTVRVSDGSVAVDQTFQVRVINFNDPPSFTSTPVESVDQNATYSYTVLATDPDGDLLTYSAPVKPAWLTFDAGTRILSGIPSDDDVGPNNVTLRVSDGTIEVDQVFVVTVINVNDPPVFTSTPLTQVNQNTQYSYTAVASDPDGDVLVYSAVQKPEWLNFGPSTHILSGTPGGNDVGFHDVILRATDGNEEVDQVFQIEVIDVNDAPQFTSSPLLMVDQDVNYTYIVLATDADGDQVAYSAPQKPTWLTFNGSTRILSGRPSNSDVGVHDVIIRATDGQLETDQAYQLTVNNVNDLPVITSTPLTIAKSGQPYIYQIDVSDPDPGDQLSFIAENVPNWLTLTPASTTAILSGTPTLNDLGTHAVIIKVSDGIADAAQGFSITVVDATGIEDASQLVSRVYPNPASDEVHFEFTELGDVLLKITDAKGAILKEVRVQHSDRFTLDISDLSSNIYFYSVTIGGKTSVGKLIKE